MIKNQLTCKNQVQIAPREHNVKITTNCACKTIISLFSSNLLSSVSQFSRSVVYNSLWPHGLQHARHPCPSPTPGVYSNSCPLEKAMAPHSSTLAWKTPWTEKPGRLQSMRSLRVRHDWATLISLFTFMHWRRKWQPTPVFLPGESQGQGSLVGCHLWGHTESDTTEVT